MLHLEAGHVDDEDEAVDLNVLVASSVSGHDDSRTHVQSH